MKNFIIDNRKRGILGEYLVVSSPNFTVNCMGLKEQPKMELDIFFHEDSHVKELLNCDVSSTMEILPDVEK